MTSLPSSSPQTYRWGPRAAWTILAVAAVLLVLTAAPVLLRGGPMADDYATCVASDADGVIGFLRGDMAYRGAVRPVRYLNAAWVGALCGDVPFGVIMLLPLVATLWAGVQVHRLLSATGVSPAWSGAAGAAWLLNPVGLEIATWPAAAHVPIGLGAALLAARLLRARRWSAALASAVLGVLCLEQLIFVLPLLAWAAAPTDRRRGALAAAISVSVVVLAVYSVFPGLDERTTASVADRLVAPFQDLQWYIRFPAIGLGAGALPGTIRWAGLWTVVAVAAGGVLGGWLLGGALRATPNPPSSQMSRRELLQTAAVGLSVVLLLNLPSIVTVPRDTSPRIFAPTWMAMSVALGLIGARLPLRRPVVAGAVLGCAAALSALALGFAADVRVRHAELSEQLLARIASEVPQDGSVVLCAVPPKLVPNAPAGAFALHDLFYDWVAEPALLHHEGRRASVRVFHPREPCPTEPAADLHVSLDELLR